MSEGLLRYWREDPLFNDHHWHWHRVYPYGGQPDRKKYSTEQLLAFSHGNAKPAFLIWNDRHGELFAYMHSQLLARYAAERLSVGLPPQEPLGDYRLPIPEGYDPGIVLTLEGQQLQVGGRPGSATLAGLASPNQWSGRPGARIEGQEQFRDRLKAALESISSANRPASLAELGERIEPTDRFASPYFGALHNDGHLLISMYDNDDKAPGVLFYEAAAVRDPVFYRWHAHIDELFQQYEDEKGPQSFSELPPVKTEGFAIVSDSGAKNRIATSMRSRVIAPGSVNQTTIDYLAHEDFWYVVRATNPLSKPVSVTVRIFMAPEQSLDSRRSWIEMDKFRQKLQPGIQVFERSSRKSSVVRHPVQTVEVLEGRELAPSEIGTAAECRCGWPYTLLVPRGTPDGMPVRFMVLLTPGNDLHHAVHDPTNASYCGLRDSKYPDKRPMGYPFDRPFRGTVREWIDGASPPKQLMTASAQIVHTGKQ